MRNKTGTALTVLLAFGVSALIGADFPHSSATVSTDIGGANVALGSRTARVAENVNYREDVERIGDVVLIDGRPSAPIEDERIAAMWDIVDAIWPASLRDDLRQVSVINEASRGLVGVVHPASDGGWILSLDAADVDDRELIEETVVHEISHLVTLDSAVFSFETNKCDGRLIPLGCAADGTVLATFADRFWPEGDPSRDPNDFVNDYAATAVHEDLAETFTAMVLEWPVNNETVEAKIALLASDGELALLAAEILALTG